MATANDATYVGAGRESLRRVLFVGTANFTLNKGTAVFYDRDYGTATAVSGFRDRRVNTGGQLNNSWFAGVTAEKYTIDSTGQCLIHIVEPGSVAQVAIVAATTLGAYGTASITHNRFGPAGNLGKGTVRFLQTVAAVTDTTSVGVISSSLDGTATVASDGKTITKTGIGTYAVAGDKVFIVGGATTATMAAGVTTGEYTIASVTSSSVVVLSTACGSIAASIAYYNYRGNPTAQAELLDGQQSGCTEWVTPLSGTAVASMVGGKTFLFGGATITTDSTATLADGIHSGQTKEWLLMGALTTNDYLVTVTTGEQLDGSTDLASLEFDGAADHSRLEWGGAKWRLIHNTGTGLA